MHTWWRLILDRLRGSFWFIPALTSAAAVALAVGLITVDFYVETTDNDALVWLRAGDAEAVRTLLSTFMAAVITIISIVFSITIVALQLASSQFGPRMLRNYMRDRGTQVTMGVFIATFLYCLTVMITMGRLRKELAVPHISVLGAGTLTVVSLGMLIYFIHHIARMISASQVITAVDHELRHAIDRLYPDAIEPGRQAAVDPGPPREVGQAATVCCERADYIQSIAYRQMAEVAAEHGLTVQLLYRAGLFVSKGHVIARVWPRDAVDDKLLEKIRNCFYFGEQRTPTQDVEFAFTQLVEIAVRALSPGINDPFTALHCIDRIAAGLAVLAGREMAGPTHLGEDLRDRIVTDRSSYAGIADVALNQIRQNGKGKPAITLRMLEGIQRVAADVRTDEQRDALRQHAAMIHEDALGMTGNAHDRRDITARYEEALRRLDGTDRGDKPAG